jgi:hypothetical protein
MKLRNRLIRIARDGNPGWRWNDRRGGLNVHVVSLNCGINRSAQANDFQSGTDVNEGRKAFQNFEVHDRSLGLLSFFGRFVSSFGRHMGKARGVQFQI